MRSEWGTPKRPHEGPDPGRWCPLLLWTAIWSRMPVAQQKTLRHRIGVVCGLAVDRWCVRGYHWGTFRNGFAAGYQRRHARAGTRFCADDGR